MARLLPAVTLALAAACTPSLATGIGGEWHLVGIEGQRAAAPASITFTSDGKISGKAPCNRYFGSYSGELPDLAFAGVGSTRMACDQLAAEDAYFRALQAVTGAELDQEHLFLIGAEGRVLEFARDPADDKCLTCGK